jgi:hypothetical protein
MGYSRGGQAVDSTMVLRPMGKLLAKEAARCHFELNQHSDDEISFFLAFDSQTGGMPLMKSLKT